MGIALAAIGVITSYKIETTAGTMPTSGYTKLPDIKGIPATDSSPNTADATTFDNIEFTSYVKLLKDLGGALSLTANFTNELYTAWTAMCEAYSTGMSSTPPKRLWICFDIPGFSNSAYLPVEPSKMGIPETTANTLIETTLYITPIGEPVFAADPTYATSSSNSNP